LKFKRGDCHDSSLDISRSGDSGGNRGIAAWRSIEKILCRVVQSIGGDCYARMGMVCGWNLYRGSYYPSHAGNHVATDLEVIAGGS